MKNILEIDCVYSSISSILVEDNIGKVFKKVSETSLNALSKQIEIWPQKYYGNPEKKTILYVQNIVQKLVV